MPAAHIDRLAALTRRATTVSRARNVRHRAHGSQRNRRPPSATERNRDDFLTAPRALASSCRATPGGATTMTAENVSLWFADRRAFTIVNNAAPPRDPN